MSLCENGQQLHVIPGTYTPTEALDLPGVKVLMKNDLPATLAALRQKKKQAAMVENCSASTQAKTPLRFPPTRAIPGLPAVRMLLTAPCVIYFS